MKDFINKKLENIIDKVYRMVDPYEYVAYRYYILINLLNHSNFYHDLYNLCDDSGLSSDWFENCKETHDNLYNEMRSAYSELRRGIITKQLSGLSTILFIEEEFENAIHRGYSSTEHMYLFLS